jgi:hypothetical protein
MSRQAPDRYPEWVEAARRLVDHLEGGGALIPEDPGLRLSPGERQYARLQVDGFRYLSAPGAPYGQATVLGFGSLMTLTLTALATAAWNSHRRRQAEVASRARWRSLGRLDLVVTSARILVLEELTWRSIWLDRIIQAIPGPDHHQLDILFDEVPALRVDGPPVPFLAVMLRHLTNGEPPVLPGSQRRSGQEGGPDALCPSGILSPSNTR